MIVAGAGLSGLACSLGLALRGRPVTPTASGSGYDNGFALRRGLTPTHLVTERLTQPFD